MRQVVGLAVRSEEVVCSASTYLVGLLCAEFDIGGVNVTVTNPPHSGGILYGIRDCGWFRY